MSNEPLTASNTLWNMALYSICTHLRTDKAKICRDFLSRKFLEGPLLLHYTELADSNTTPLGMRLTIASIANITSLPQRGMPKLIEILFEITVYQYYVHF
jgi:hypothetical protein